MTDTTLETQIRDALKQRSAWEDRQRVFYEMRHQGLRRAHKPFPGAADLHFPLADTQIEKLKPFYFAQMYATETFAALICKRPGQQADLTTAAGQWLDYKLRSRSNFQTEALIAVDRMLGAGSAALKVYWDAKRRQVRFAAPQVTHLIMPTYTEDIQDADWVVHVQQMSAAQYRANSAYRQDGDDDDGDFLKRIMGKDSSATSNTGADQEKERREGITHGATDEMIVLWEIYVHDHTAGTWTVKTRSPLAFDEEIRPDFGVPYEHGKLPFVYLMAEVKEQGCFSSRGITEVTAPFETSINKTWNQKHDWMAFNCNPQFYSEKEIVNVSNIQMRPGQILPFGLRPVPPVPAPEMLEQEMNSTREIAEYRVGLPDFGVLKEGGDNRTATEANLVAGQSSTISDIRTRLFRIMLGEVYAQAWALLVQYDGEDLTYTVSDAVQDLDPTALHQEYEILANGSDQSWNRTAQLQRGQARFALFKDNPYIDQGELVKSLLEIDDPRLVKRLFVDPQTKAATQQEEQAMEIATMLLGFPCSVQPQDDDAAHLQCIAGFVQRRLAHTGEPMTPELARLILAHGGEHAKAMEQKKNPQAKQIEQQMTPMVALLGQIAQQPDQPPANVVPGPNAGPAALPAPGGAGAAPAGADTSMQDLGIKQLNALAVDHKAGVPITPEQWNVAFKNAGLPEMDPSIKLVHTPDPQPQEVAA